MDDARKARVEHQHVFARIFDFALVLKRFVESLDLAARLPEGLLVDVEEPEAECHRLTQGIGGTSQAELDAGKSRQRGVSGGVDERVGLELENAADGRDGDGSYETSFPGRAAERGVEEDADARFTHFPIEDELHRFRIDGAGVPLFAVESIRLVGVEQFGEDSLAQREGFLLAVLGHLRREGHERRDEAIHGGAAKRPGGLDEEDGHPPACTGKRGGAAGLAAAHHDKVEMLLTHCLSPLWVPRERFRRRGRPGRAQRRINRVSGKFYHIHVPEFQMYSTNAFVGASSVTTAGASARA